MHPEMSLVFLTVLSGIGQGLFILLVVMDMLFGFALSYSFMMAAGILSLLFPALGGLASVFHLGNPQRGYKALKMVKSSWLSREAVFLPVFMLFAFLYLVLFYLDVPDGQRIAVGLLGVVASFALYVSSAMLYAKIRFIKEWANGYTVANYILLGLVSGFAVLIPLMDLGGVPAPMTDTMITAGTWLATFALLVKAVSLWHNNRAYQPIRLHNALGVSDPRVKITDWGTTFEHYNTTEFSYKHGRGGDGLTQVGILLAVFVVPVSAWCLMGDAAQAGLGLLAAASVVGGLLLERRFFFIQGNHLQNLYYGNFRFNEVGNPIASKRSR